MSSIISKLINLNGNITGTLPIANGGTGQIIASAAFNALSPITTTGDMIYSASGATNSRLPIATNGKFLRAGASVPGYGWNNINAVSSADYTITDTDGYDCILMSTGATLRTVTLPVPTNNTGRTIFVKKTDSGVGTVVISRQTSGTIDGVTTVTLYLQYDFIWLLCDGTNWQVVDVFQSVYLYARGANNAGSTTVPFKNATVTDTAAAYSATTGQFTTPAFPAVSRWMINAASYGGGTSYDLCIYIGGTFTYQGSQGTTSTLSLVSANVSLAAGTTIEVRPDANATASGTTTANYLTIVKC